MEGLPCGSDSKVSACNVGDPGSIPGSGRSPGEGNGNPLQYSCLENSKDWGAWWATVHGVTKSWTQLSDFTYGMWDLSSPTRDETCASPALQWKHGILTTGLSKKSQDLDFIPHVPQHGKNSHAAHKLPPVSFPMRVTCHQSPDSEVWLWRSNCHCMFIYIYCV